MSTPENERIEEQSEPIDEQSTIFSNPAHFNDAPRTVKNRSVKKLVISAVCCALVLGLTIGSYIIIKKIPDKNSQQQQQGNAIQSNSVQVLNTNTLDVKEITVKNENTTFTIRPNIRETDGEQTTEWTVDGVKSKYTDSDAIKSIADVVLLLEASEKVKTEDGIKPEDIDKQFGFDKPNITAKVVTKDEANSYTVYFGDNAPAQLGIYCKVSNKQEVYIVSDDTVLTLQAEVTDFAVTTGFAGAENNSKTASCFENGSITKFDYITVNGTAYKNTLKVEMQNDDSINAYFAYQITSPGKRIADDTKVEQLLECFENGIMSYGAYCFEPTKADLKKYKLDKPEYTVTISLNGQKTAFSFSQASETYYALIDESKEMIHKIPIAYLPIAENTLEDYYSSFIILEMLSGLDGMQVNTPDGKIYNFDLKFTAANEDKGVESDKYQAFYNGKELDIENFKRYYTKLISLTAISYDYKTGLKEAARITLKHSANTRDVVMIFREYSAGRYQVEVDGTFMGLITATEFNKLMDDTPKVAAGKTVTE